MAKVNAVACDLKTCQVLAAPAEGKDIPEGWFSVDVYQEGTGNLNGDPLIFHSWGCISMWANNKIVSPPKRKRRTREQIEADEAAAQG